MIFSEHARRRMRERGISEQEVTEALGRVFAQTPAITWTRVNLWGSTFEGRTLRITTYRYHHEYVITVVAVRGAPR